MGDWTTYFHDRLSRIERHLFGEGQATAIATDAPPYTATTEALTTGASNVPPVVPVTGSGPNQPPVFVPREGAPEPVKPGGVVDESTAPPPPAG